MQFDFVSDLDTPKPHPKSRAYAYSVPKYTIKLVKDGSVTREDKTIRRPMDIHEVACAMLSQLDRENMIVIMLNTRNKIIGVNTILVGGLNFINLDMRAVFKPALLCNADSIALAHNHPSGDPMPSPEDVHATEEVIKAAKLLDITLLDHLVVADNPGTGAPMLWYSMRETGLVNF